MGLSFTFPELETFTRWDPGWGRPDIDNDELNEPTAEQLADVLFGERSDPCGGFESIGSPQFLER
jgi:hypothetical protein